MLPDERLIEIQVETLFRAGTDGRLSAVNEPGMPLAPRFFLGRTRNRNLVRYRHDLPADLVRILDSLVAAEPVGAALTGEPPVTYDSIRATLQAHGPVRDEWRGPAYRFPDALPPGAFDTPLPLVEVGANNVGVLEGPFASLATVLPAILPCVAVVAEGAAVAVCHAARRSARAAEAGVITLPGFRGCGHGSAVVAAWARAVRRTGLLPLYSTSWDNTASRRLAQRLGLVLYAEDIHLT